MGKQLALELTDTTAAESSPWPVSYEDIHVSRSTFLNGLATRVHRWFRLTPSFGPELVHEMIERLEVGQDDLILDPFAGAGTTLIEAQLEGRRAIGFEINPLLHFVNEISLDWSLKPDDLRQQLARIPGSLLGGTISRLSCRRDRTIKLRVASWLFKSDVRERRTRCASAACA